MNSKSFQSPGLWINRNSLLRRLPGVVFSPSRRLHSHRSASALSPHVKRKQSQYPLNEIIKWMCCYLFTNRLYSSDSLCPGRKTLKITGPFSPNNNTSFVNEANCAPVHLIKNRKKDDGFIFGEGWNSPEHQNWTRLLQMCCRLNESEPRAMWRGQFRLARQGWQVQ